MRGVDDDRQVRDAAQKRKHAEVERVAGERLERADAALAQDDVAVAARDDVLGGHEPLLDGRGQPAFQHHRFAELADALEEREVLHVARTDLEDVGIFGDEWERLGVLHFGDDGHVRGVARFGEDLEPFFFQPLEIVGAGARLESAAAKHVRAVLANVLGRRHHLLARLDRAGTGHHAEGATADLHAAHFDDRGVGFDLAADELVRLRDGHGVGHAVEPGEERRVERPAVARHADGGALGARHLVGNVTELADAVGNGADLIRRCVLVHCDDHGGSEVGAALRRGASLLPSA